MDRRRIRRTDTQVSVLALGGAPLAGLYEPVPEAQAEQTVRRALERGMRYLDTAPHYGAGLSERRIGQVLDGRPRQSFVVSTKVGRRLRPRRHGEPLDDAGFPEELPYKREWDWSADGIRHTLDESLARLGVDRVDVAYLHDPDDHEDRVYAEAYPALVRLRDEGVVTAIGAGMNQTAMLTRFVRRLDIDVVLCAGRYTLLDQSALVDLLPACLDRGTSVVVGGVFNSGLLADPTPGARYEYAPAAPELLARAQRLREVCDAHDVPLRAAALQFPLRHPAVTSVLVGCRSPSEVDDNTAMLDRSIPESLWSDLAGVGVRVADLEP
jgi:D-threo-aldose 1-dehydrogenase